MKVKVSQFEFEIEDEGKQAIAFVPSIIFDPKHREHVIDKVAPAITHTMQFELSKLLRIPLDVEEDAE